jgi:hypothetical protein
VAAVSFAYPEFTDSRQQCFWFAAFFHHGGTEEAEVTEQGFHKYLRFLCVLIFSLRLCGLKSGLVLEVCKMGGE